MEARRFEGAVVDDSIDICLQVGKNFQREVAKRLLNPLNQLSRVGPGKRKTQKFAELLLFRVLTRLEIGASACNFCKSLEVSSKGKKIIVIKVRFEPKTMFDGDRESADKVDS